MDNIEESGSDSDSFYALGRVSESRAVDQVNVDIDFVHVYDYATDNNICNYDMSSSRNGDVSSKTKCKHVHAKQRIKKSNKTHRNKPCQLSWAKQCALFIFLGIQFIVVLVLAALIGMHISTHDRNLYLIAFRATTLAKTTMKFGDIYTFTYTLFNDGGGYDSTNGIFTAPHSGHYLFGANICSAVNSSVHYAILQDNRIIATHSERGKTFSKCTSLSVIIKLMERNKVWIEPLYPYLDTIQEDYSHVCFFQGVMLH